MTVSDVQEFQSNRITAEYMHKCLLPPRLLIRRLVVALGARGRHRGSPGPHTALHPRPRRAAPRVRAAVRAARWDGRPASGGGLAGRILRRDGWCPDGPGKYRRPRRPAGRVAWRWSRRPRASGAWARQSASASCGRCGARELAVGSFALALVCSLAVAGRLLHALQSDGGLA